MVENSKIQFSLGIDMEKDLITADEAAKLKGVSRAAIYAAISEGRLPHLRVLNRIALRSSDVKEWTPIRYSGRAGVKGGRPKGTPMSAETKARISEAQRQRWSERNRKDSS